MSRRIARALAAVADGVGDNIDDDEIGRRLEQRWWTPIYPEFTHDERDRR